MLTSILGGFACALILARVELSYFDTLFLDFRQFIYAPPLKKSEMVFVNTSPLKAGAPKIPVDSFRKTVEQLQLANPKRLIILCSVFAENLEVQQIAHRHGALLLSKDLLPRLELSLIGSKSFRGKQN